jgi:hypothetical protein
LVPTENSIESGGDNSTTTEMDEDTGEGTINDDTEDSDALSVLELVLYAGGAVGYLVAIAAVGLTD